MSVFELLFWVAIGLVAYLYLLFPALLFLLSRFSQFKTQEDNTFLPSISFLIAAYNEEDVIEEKIRNLRSLDYPKDKMNIYIGSDASTDATDRILAEAGEGINYVRFEERQGKSNILNKLAEKSTSDILVFSDANTIYKNNALRQMIRHFADPRVGGVCGYLELGGKTLADLGRLEKSYWRFESGLKAMEGRFGRVIGANGAIYSIRRQLFTPIPTKRLLMDDFFVTLSILKAGHRMVFERNARAFEQSSARDKGEFSRKIRIAQANFNLLWSQPRFLFSGDPIFIFLFYSHKVLRWIAPAFLGMALVFNAMMILKSYFYYILFFSQMLFYITAALGALFPKSFRILTIPYYFVSMNLALTAGFFKSLNPRQAISWKRVERKS